MILVQMAIAETELIYRHAHPEILAVCIWGEDFTNHDLNPRIHSYVQPQVCCRRYMQPESQIV